MPLFRSLASNEEAWQATRGLPEVTSQIFPSDAMLWATAGTEHATTWAHIDDHGLATVVKVMTGLKYWVIMYPKKERAKKDTKGDLCTRNAFGTSATWQPSSACGDLWDHEGVLLEAGDTL
jgi:hypothetical protein